MSKNVQSLYSRPYPLFPEAFLKGVGMSVFQNSSDGPDCDHPSNWGHFIRNKNFLGQKEYVSAWQKSNDFWNLYEDDIKLAKDTLGTNSFRFSFEWSRIEPSGPGEVDQDAVKRFHQIIDCIKANGMEPMCTLHHFTHPQWFEDLGGFTKEENIPLFIAYCKRMFTWFAPKIRMWATFNEPTVYAFVGHIAGLWCPGKLMEFTLCGKVLLTLLKAHVAAYKELKALPGGQETCIGLVHQHIRFVPKTGCTPHIALLCKWMTYWFASETILRFFKSGVFEWKVPFHGVKIREECPEASETIDWWGINYYSSPCLSAFFVMGSGLDNEPVFDNQFRLYPQGMYDAVHEASSLQRPIFITETGGSDKDGKYRRRLIEAHCNMVLKCVADGYDVRGMYYWTLMDNIEWHEGFHIKFGLYEWDPVLQRTKVLRMRPGGEALKEQYDNWPDDLIEFKRQAEENMIASSNTYASTTNLLAASTRARIGTSSASGAAGAVAGKGLVNHQENLARPFSNGAAAERSSMEDCGATNLRASASVKEIKVNGWSHPTAEGSGAASYKSSSRHFRSPSTTSGKVVIDQDIPLTPTRVLIEEQPLGQVVLQPVSGAAETGRGHSSGIMKPSSAVVAAGTVGSRAVANNGVVMKRSNPMHDETPVVSGDGVSRASSIASIDLDKLTATGDTRSNESGRH